MPDVVECQYESGLGARSHFAGGCAGRCEREDDMNRDLLITDKLPRIPTTAVSQEVRSPILLSEEEMELVAGGDLFGLGTTIDNTAGGVLEQLLPF
jgi:hypothetical protein